MQADLSAETAGRRELIEGIHIAILKKGFYSGKETLGDSIKETYSL